MCFKYAGQATWAEAVTLCELEDAQLPLPLNIQEDMDLYSYLNSLFLLSSWLDGTDEANEGNWVDSYGNNITYFNWRSDQPDNNGGNEHFLHYRSGWNGMWNDHLATHIDHVLCQKPSFGKYFYFLNSLLFDEN